MRAVAITLIVILAAGGVSHAAEEPVRTSLCLMLQSAADANRLPLPFLARVIWRESRFDPDAVGPATRSGAHAQGIAQFMPGTAAEQALGDPFDPVQALPKAAAYLASLRDRFGNLGLAAAAYNAGPTRVQGWLDGTRSMPDETRTYVAAITGRTVDDWKQAGGVDMLAAKEDCPTLVASLQKGPSHFFYELEQRVASAIGKPWGVELAAGFSRARVLRSRGTRPLYQARIGVETRLAANDLCGTIRRAGAACVVLRNGH